MLLLTGPPGSGKTQFVLENLRQALPLGDGRVRLITPTATMAEHLRNQLAREGFVLRANSIQTLSKFVGSLTPDLAEVPPAVFQLLVRKALTAADCPEFRRVLEFPGFQRAMANLIEELASAGCGPQAVPLPDGYDSLGAVFSRVHDALRLRGLFLRSERLRAAASSVQSGGLPGVETILFDGFYTFAPIELELIRALASRANVVVTLPEWEGAELSKRNLWECGFEERRSARVRATPQAVVVAAANIEQEVKEIARRILEQAAAGRLFREIGVVVRGYGPYAPALRTTFERFGIPARYYFPQPLTSHPAVARLVRLVDAVLGGWDHQMSLGALRMLPASTALDRIEFAVLEQIPGRGLDSLSALDDGGSLNALLDRASQMSGKASAAALKSLCSAFPAPTVTDATDHEQAFLWRSHAAAIDAFGEVIDQIAEAFGDAKNVSFDAFWAEAKANLAAGSFWPRDHRRNVVAVIDAYEARQWELPVVFVCGMVEKQFPRAHFESPLLGDEARLQLRSHGIHLRTSADQNVEERFLFELAATRATQSLVLTYPKYNDKGDENLRSFLLDAFLKANAHQVEPAVSVRPAASRPQLSRSSPVIREPELLEWLRQRNATLSPSSIQRFLECPFAFFAGKSIKLKGWPALPAERLDPLLQGVIVHDVLAQCLGMPLMLEQTFEEIFDQHCREESVPSSHRTEAVRLEMLRSLRDFLQQALLPGARETLKEQSFELPLTGGITIRGRIDRIDILRGRKALVIDYKYAASYRMRSYISANEGDASVQAGLYLLAARQVFKCEPLGMLFCAMRRDVEWGGWHVNWPGCAEIGANCAPGVLQELVDKAVAKTLEVAHAISQGRIEPLPADASICERCDFRDICRIESPALVTVAGGRNAG